MENISRARKVCRRFRPSARCGRGKKKQIKKCADRIDRNGFLNHSFQPFWGITTPAIAATEREFFNSLSNCCNCYGFEIPDVSALPFPLNVSAAFKMVKEKCEAVKESCIIVSDKKRKAAIATAKVYDTGYTLYYIPVRPLWILQQDNNQKPLADLIICVFSYLYRVAGVPYFRRSGYLAGMYEIMEEWIDNDEEGDEYRERQKTDMENMKIGADDVFTCISKPYNRKHLERLLKQYENTTCFNGEMYNVCNDLLQLSIDFPRRSIKENLNTILLDEEQDEHIYIEQYISFYWSSFDELCEPLFEMVNNELQEKGEMEEPMSLKVFDEPKYNCLHDFDFETRLFNCLNILIEQLNLYDEKYHQRVQ